MVVAGVLLVSALTGAAPARAAVADEGGTPTAARAPARLPLEGYWHYAGGTVKVTARGGTINAVAATHLGLWDSGTSECVTWRPGEAAWGAVTGSGLDYVGMVRWWDDTKDPCQPIGDDTRATFTVSRDLRSLRVCSTPPGEDDAWRQCYTAYRRASVVATLGDSYSSGEGAGSYDRSSGSCHRSPYAWTKYLEARNPGRWQVDSFLACSGAVTFSLTQAFKGEPAQVTRFHPLTEVVTLTIGGNDVGFSSVLKNCVLSGNLVKKKNCVENGTIKKTRQFIRQHLEKYLVRAYSVVKASMPKDARFVVVGYPRLFPLAGKTEKCRWLDGQERKAVNALAVELNEKIRTVATRSGAEFVDVLDVLNGHEMCTSERRTWMFNLGRDARIDLKDAAQGPKAIKKLLRKLLTPETGHPTAPGQDAIARRVGRTLGYS